MSIDEFVRAFRSRANLYHFTDVRNLDSIRTHGLLSLSELERKGIVIPAAGGNDWSHTEDRRRSLDGYVHLCMRNQHPMEYKARLDERIGETRFLSISLDALLAPGVQFTADVSNKAGVELLTWEQANEQFDWEVLYGRTDWKKPEIQQRLKTAEKYEVLIPTCVALNCIRNL